MLKLSFLGLLKHYKNRCFSKFVSFFLLLKEKKTGKKDDNWNFRIWIFLVEKWLFRDAYLLFKKRRLRPLFLLCFGGARFLGRVVKKRNFGHPPQKHFD